MSDHTPDGVTGPQRSPRGEGPACEIVVEHCDEGAMLSCLTHRLPLSELEIEPNLDALVEIADRHRTAT